MNARGFSLLIIPAIVYNLSMFKRSPIIHIACLISYFVFLSACSSSGSGSADVDPESALASADWRSITNDGNVLAGIKFSGATAELTVINHSSGEVGSPSLTSYDLSTGEAISIGPVTETAITAGGSYQGSFTFPGSSSPESSALITGSFGGEQAAVFVTAETYASLSPSYIDPSLSSYISPYSGTWDFEMQIGTDYLSGSNCPSSPSGSTTTSGDATLYVSDSGYSAMWLIDGSVVTFSRSAINQDFVSPDYTFPVESDSGTVYGNNGWTLTPQSQSSITGVLNWDNTLGCTATYPVAMTSQSTSTSPSIILCEGIWNITYNPIVCGATVIPSGSLPLLPNGSGTLDVSYAADIPLFLSFSSFASYQSLPNLGGTNVYGSGLPNMTLGTTVDFSGNPLVIVGGTQMTAISSTSIQGVLTVYGFGPNPCTGTSTFTMSSVSGC